jgi:hypothetical protein
MYQFKNRSKWLTHIKEHRQGLDHSKPMVCHCRMAQCTESFDLGLKLLFHLQDAHGIPLIKKRKSWKTSRKGREEGESVQELYGVSFIGPKRPREESEELQPVRKKRQRQGYEKDEPKIKEELIEFSFITTTPEIIRDRASVKSSTSSGSSTPSLISTSNVESQDSRYGVETPASPVYDKIPIDPAIFHQATSAPDLNDIDKVDLTEVRDTFDPTCLAITTIQGAY